MTCQGRKKRSSAPSPLVPLEPIVPWCLVRARGAGVAALLALATLACGDGEIEPPPPPPDTPVVPVFPFEDTATSIEFLDPEGLTLVAGTPREIRVRVSPPGTHIVRFALLRTEDAFLSTDIVTTEPDGTGSVTLTALTASSGFSLLAMVGRLQQPRFIVVSDANLASLLLVPNYPVGTRTVQRWSASVHLNRTCQELMGPPFPDGEALTTGTAREVQLNRVPAGVPLAAVIRAERFAFGCQTLASGLRASSNTITQVEVVDRPLQLAELELQLAISVEQATSLNPALDELAFRAVGPLLGTASDDLAAVLDAMSSLAVDSVAFEQARADRDWRGVLQNALGGAMVRAGLRTAIDDWMSAGLGELSQPEAIVGTLSAPDAAGQAPFTLSSVSGLEPEAAGFAADNVASVTTTTGDMLGVAATLSWSPTPLLAALAERVAIGESGASSVPDALARELDCANVAELLVDAGASPGEAFPDCDDACVLRLCDDAMSVLWSRITDAPLPAVPWEINAASPAQIDGNARPTSVGGTWIGRITLSDASPFSIQGVLAGATPE